MSIPVLIFFCKIAINIAFLNSYQASYREDVIFPFYKRATSIGICNFIARSVTIAAPLIAELPKPTPAIILLVASLVAFVAAFFLPSR